jgi:hypothetical protein
LLRLTLEPRRLTLEAKMAQTGALDTHVGLIPSAKRLDPSRAIKNPGSDLMVPRKPLLICVENHLFFSRLRFFVSLGMSSVAEILARQERECRLNNRKLSNPV